MMMSGLNENNGAVAEGAPAAAVAMDAAAGDEGETTEGGSRTVLDNTNDSDNNSSDSSISSSDSSIITNETTNTNDLQQQLLSAVQQLDNNTIMEALAQALKDEQDRVNALPCMQITEQEREWAIAIKQAAEADPDILVEGVLSDLDYVQYAIVTQGNVADSLKRMKGLQLFRQEYGINDTLEQGSDMLEQLLQKQPGFILSIDRAKTAVNPMIYGDDDGNEYGQDQLQNSHYLMVLDFAKMDPKAIRMPKDKRDMLGALYYCHHAIQPNPAAIRNGILFIAECEGMTFDNISLDYIGPIWREMKCHYPIHLKEISWLRAATAATVMYALAKPFVPKHIQAKVNLGCEFQAFDGRLDALFLTQPTPQENMLLILQKASNHLAERLRNVQLFRL